MPPQERPKYMFRGGDGGEGYQGSVEQDRKGTHKVFMIVSTCYDNMIHRLQPDFPNALDQSITLTPIDKRAQPVLDAPIIDSCQSDMKVFWRQAHCLSPDIPFIPHDHIPAYAPIFTPSFTNHIDVIER